MDILITPTKAIWRKRKCRVDLILNSDLQFITDIRCWIQTWTAMLNRKREQREYRTRKTEAEKRIEEVRAEVEKVLKRLRQIEIEV